jgi:hypothetical protein
MFSSVCIPTTPSTPQSIQGANLGALSFCASLDIEMGALLDSVKTKKKKEPDRFFYVAFNSPNQVYGTRGFVTRRDLSEYLLDRQIPGIKMKLTL